MRTALPSCSGVAPTVTACMADPSPRTASLVATHEARITLAPSSTGPKIYNPCPRGVETFLSIDEHPYDDWRHGRGRRKAAVELALDYPVPNIVDHTDRRAVGYTARPFPPAASTPPRALSPPRLATVAAPRNAVITTVANPNHSLDVRGHCHTGSRASSAPKSGSSR